MTTSAKIYGRAWIFDTGDPPILDFWTTGLIPMLPDKTADCDWAQRYFSDCVDEAHLRDMFGLPKTGCYQVVFSGEMEGYRVTSFDGDEWDEDFQLDEDHKHEKIPAPFLELLLGDK